ncbi:hypothetical protein N643_02330 [Salmonella bongori serovar 48:z41:-- str. RKS3044]|nr:hypothetical protein N643_02330 [Salmonella bongori serovar 48:z41:-- str. RKS3044]
MHDNKAIGISTIEYIGICSIPFRSVLPVLIHGLSKIIESISHKDCDKNTPFIPVIDLKTCNVSSNEEDLNGTHEKFINKNVTNQAKKLFILIP